MAGNIPVGGMETDITLNGTQPVRTLKELRQAVTNATSAWKAQRAELSSVGKSTEAAKAKFDGLKTTIDKQKEYISGLTREQKNLVEAQKNVDRSTQTGKQEYAKYGEQIAKSEGQIKRAETRLTSLTSQQNKAKDSLRYYESGLAQVQKQLKQNSDVTKSYVERLSSEGRKYDAAKTQLNGYRDAVSSLSKQQKIQVDELNRIGRESGKTSDAYARQRIRVNETTTSLNNYNTKIKASQKEVDRLNPNGFNRIANGAKHVTNAADKMKSAMSKTWQSIKTGATTAAIGIGAVGAAAISGAKKSASLQQSYKEITNLAVTGGEKQKEAIANVTKMQSQGRDMSIQYGKSQQAIAEAFEDLVKRGYTTKQALGAMRTELQGSVASGDDFADVVKVSSTTLESFGLRAKTTAEMTRNTKRAVNELAYAADMTSTGFKDLGYGMSYVGASAHQAGIPLSQVASALGIASNNGIEASKAGTGLNQVINRLSDSAAKLAKGDKKNVLAQMGISPKEILDSKGNLKDLAVVFGVLNKHMQGLSKTKKINLMKSLFGVNGEQVGLILAKFNKQLGTLSEKTLKAGKDGDYVAKLANKNSETAKMQMARLKQTGEAFSMTLGAKMLPAINKAGDSLVVFLTKSKDGKKLTNDFAKAVEAMSTCIVKMIEWIAKHRTEVKWIAGGLGATYGVTKLAQFTVAINKTRLALKGLSESSKVFKTLKNGLANLTSSIGSIGSGKLTGLLQSARSAGGFKNLTTAGKIGNGIAGAGVAIDAGASFLNAYQNRHSADKRSQDIGKGIGAGIGGGIGLWFGGPAGAAIGAKIGSIVGKWGGQAVNKFTKGWQAKKPPKSFWSVENLGWSTKSMFNSMGKGINSFFKSVNKNKYVKAFKKGDFFKVSSKDINKNWKSFVNQSNKNSKKFYKDFKKNWGNFWKSVNSNRYVKAFKKGKFFQTALNDMKSRWKSFSSDFGKKWSSLWKGVNSNRYVKAFQKGKFFSTALKDIKSRWASFKKTFGKGWNDFWKGLGEGFKSFGKSIKDDWTGSINNIIGGFNDVVHAFGGSKKTIGYLHFANGTDWKKRYGVPAVLNDGNDSPETGNREGILNSDGSVEIVNGRFVKRWLLPGQDVIKASDMAKMFGKANHLANGTVTIKQKERSYKKELDRLGDKISKTIKDGNLQRSKELTAEFNKISKKYSALKKSTKKSNPHKGKTLVDQGLLTGADRRIGHSVWISDKLFKQLTTAPKAAKKSTRRSSSRRTGTRKSSSTSLSGGSSSISTAGIKSKSVKILAKVSGTKSVNALAKAIKKIKNTKKKVTVKVSGAKSLKSLSKAIKTVNKELKTLTKTAKKNNVAKAFSSMSDKSVKEFKSMGKSIDKEATSIQKDTDKKFSTMQKKIESSMKNINSGVTKLAKSTASGFKNALHKMIGYAESDMKGTINALNRGIKGIDKVLEQFGGNSSVIKPVKFAKGTVNGALTHDTLAMVNDDQYGPRQEAIVRGNNLLIPRGKDRIIPLQKGDQVLNGLQTQELANRLGLPHFAKGSGMSHSSLRKLAERSLKNYANSFKSMFTKNVDAKGTNVEKGFTDLGNRSSTEYGNKWSQAMWTVIENAIGDGIGHGGTREAFLKYAEDNFTGVKYVMGAASKLASDCSGMVSQALKHFGVNIGRTTVAMQESSGVQYLGKSLSKTEPGDLVIFGHGSGAAGHVGIIKNPEKGTMFNETPPSARVSRISDGASMGYGFYRVKGLHDAKSKKDNGPSKSLLNLAKKELGASAIKWIKKNLSEAISSFKISGDIGTRAGVLAKALKQLDPKATKNGITAILGNWMFESTLNPGAVNSSGGASGLGQWLGGRLTNLKAFAKKHGKSWKDPATQLLFALKHDGSDSNIFKSVLEGNGSVASLAAKFSQMWERGGYTAQHVAGAQQIASSIPKFSNGGIANRPSIFGDAGAEMAVPLVPTKATRAWELIGKAIGILSAQSGFGNQPVVDFKEKKEEKDFRQAVLLLLERLVNKDNSANITLTTPQGRTLWSVVEPFYKENERANQIKQRRGLSGGF